MATNGSTQGTPGVPTDSNAALADFARQQRENEALKAQVEALKAENARLAATKGAGRLSIKIGDKGGVSVYGLGRFPVTLYREQWERLLSAETVTAIRRFITDNADRLKTKAQADEEKATAQ